MKLILKKVNYMEKKMSGIAKEEMIININL